MCGIAGMFDRTDRPIDPSVLARMTDTLAHRGPDGSGVWNDGPIGLGHRRLAIRDLTEAARQPMQDATGRVTVTYNGEIYNEVELRRELERDFGVRFRTSCDAEIIPAGWIHWGERLLDRLEGMFAFGLWDARDRCLVLARDGMGIKPLFVADDETRVRFGSEVKALLADPAQPKRIDASALHRYLAQGYVGPDATLLQGVRQVAPGAIERYDRDRMTSRTYWQPSRRPDIFRLDDAVDAFEPVWSKVVAEQLISDVPVGVLQSGGIDSTLITLSLPRDRPVPLFTAGFDQASHDETSVAADVASQLGLNHHAVPVELSAAPIETFRAVVRHFDGQVADSSGFALYVLSRAVRPHVKVVLAGDGGDELFAGYQTYRASRLARVMGAVMPTSLAELLARVATRLGAASEERIPPSEMAARFFAGIAAGHRDAHAQWRRILPHHLQAELYGPALSPLAGAVDPLDGYRAALRNEAPSLVDRCLVADQRYYLPADLLMKVDAMSMAHGLEVRVPMLDRRVAGVAARLHPRLLTRCTGRDKRFLRHMVGRRGGPNTVTAGRKRGFNVPVARLLRGGLRPLAERVLDRDAGQFAPYLSPDSVRGLWRAHAARRANHGYLLWTLMTFAVWHG